MMPFQVASGMGSGPGYAHHKHASEADMLSAGMLSTRWDAVAGLSAAGLVWTWYCV